MAALHLLLDYCRRNEPIGAFMLNGEWGCGKTYLVEKDLTEAMKQTHIIVRISLYGLKNADALRHAVRKKWAAACSPVLGRMVNDREKREENRNLSEAVKSIAKGAAPSVGGALDLFSSFDAADMVTVKPDIEELRTHQRKKVVLVFDDLERAEMNPLEVLSIINEYCENEGFCVIILANEAYLIYQLGKDHAQYRMLKEKTVSRTVFYSPDFSRIIPEIIRTRQWNSEAYEQFLKGQEETLLEFFDMERYEPGRSGRDAVMSRNLRTFINTLEDFYCVFTALSKSRVADLTPWFTSFLAYSLSHRAGVFRNGELDLDSSDEEIQRLCPQFETGYLYPSERRWISYGVWEEEQFRKELGETV